MSYADTIDMTPDARPAIAALWDASVPQHLRLDYDELLERIDGYADAVDAVLAAEQAGTLTVELEMTMLWEERRLCRQARVMRSRAADDPVLSDPLLYESVVVGCRQGARFRVYGELRPCQLS